MMTTCNCCHDKLTEWDDRLCWWCKDDLLRKIENIEDEIAYMRTYRDIRDFVRMIEELERDYDEHKEIEGLKVWINEQFTYTKLG